MTLSPFSYFFRIHMDQKTIPGWGKSGIIFEMISHNKHIYIQIVDEVNLAGLNNLKSFGYNDDLQVNIFYKNIKFLRSIFFV